MLPLFPCGPLAIASATVSSSSCLCCCSCSLDLKKEETGSKRKSKGKVGSGGAPAHHSLPPTHFSLFKSRRSSCRRREADESILAPETPTSVVLMGGQILNHFLGQAHQCPLPFIYDMCIIEWKPGLGFVNLHICLVDVSLRHRSCECGLMVGRRDLYSCRCLALLQLPSAATHSNPSDLLQHFSVLGGMLAEAFKGAWPRPSTAHAGWQLCCSCLCGDQSCQLTPQSDLPCSCIS